MGAGRPRTYKTAKALRKAVKEYFNNISYEREPVGAPEGMKIRAWVRAPSMAGLYIHLGIGKSTWADYGADDKLGPVVEYARMMMEDFWAGELNGKFANGAKFALSANYGWTEKQEVEMGPRAQRAVAAANITTAEREELLRELAQEIFQTGEAKDE